MLALRSHNVVGFSPTSIITSIWLARQISRDELFHALPDLVRTNPPQTVRRWKPAVIRTGFIRAGFAFNPLRRRMQGREPFRQLRAEQGEGWQPAKSRQMAGPGIVADKYPRLINQCQQFGYGVRCRRLRLVGVQPPGVLVRVARNLS